MSQLMLQSVDNCTVTIVVVCNGKFDWLHLAVQRNSDLSLNCALTLLAEQTKVDKTSQKLKFEGVPFTCFAFLSDYIITKMIEIEVVPLG